MTRSDLSLRSICIRSIVTLVSACVLPHSSALLKRDGTWPGDVAANLRTAYEHILARFKTDQVGCLLIVSPHGIMVSGCASVLSAERLRGRPHMGGPFEDYVVDRDLATVTGDAIESAGCRIARVTFGQLGADEAVGPIHWGVSVPVSIVTQVTGLRLPIVPITVAPDVSLQDCQRVGRAICDAASMSARRVALVISTDLSHALARGPYGYDSRAVAYDQTIERLLSSDHLAEVELVNEELLRRARAEGWRELCLLAAALGNAFHCWIAEYAAYSYFGMICASFELLVGAYGTG